MTHVTCRLTAKNRDQLQNPTLSNRVWATLFTLVSSFVVCLHCAEERLSLTQETGMASDDAAVRRVAVWITWPAAVALCCRRSALITLTI